MLLLRDLSVERLELRLLRLQHSNGVLMTHAALLLLLLHAAFNELDRPRVMSLASTKSHGQLYVPVRDA